MPDFNLNDQRIWDQLFEKVPEQWKQAQPSEDMKDCLRFLQRHKVESVLDLGCGIGLWAVYLSKAGLRVKGVDFSTKAIDFASRWANEEGQSIEYRCAAVASRAFPEKRFHAVVAAKILDNISRPEFEIARNHIASSLVDEGLLYCLFNPFMTDEDLKRLSESDNPTRDVTQIIYSDEELRELFPRFDLLEFKRYEHGFRGLFLRKRRTNEIQALRTTQAQDEMDETKSFWDRVATDWDIQTGNDGDSNRILNSDPVLWAFAGNVRGLDVLDAGCGTGYLSRKLNERGAKVIGVDFSERMIEIARAKSPGIDFRVDSCSNLKSLDNASVDLVVANYVLMDTPDLESTLRAFHRVLRIGGSAIAVFSHPCFPQGRASDSIASGSVTYHWNHSYFERRKNVDPPWGHFTSDFIWFHRPLSDYWKAFKAAGFEIVEFEEPRVTEDRYHLAEDEKALNNSKRRPYSVAFKLRKIQ